MQARSIDGVLQWGATISATNHIGHNKTISATAKNHIGHTENQYRPQPCRPKPYRPQDIGHKIYGEFIWCHPDDTSRFRVVRMVNLNVKEISRLCTMNTPKYTLLVIPVPHVRCVHRSHLLPGLPWGLNFNAHIHPIPTEKPVGIPTSTESRNPPYS